MPAAAPAASSVLRSLPVTFTTCPTSEPSAPPVAMIGPSAPNGPPVPIAIAAESGLRKVIRGGMLRLVEQHLLHRLGDAVAADRARAVARHHADDQAADHRHQYHPPTEVRHRSGRRRECGRPAPVERQVRDQADQRNQQLGDHRRQHAQHDRHRGDPQHSSVHQGGAARHAGRVQARAHRRRQRQRVGTALGSDGRATRIVFACRSHGSASEPKAGNSTLLQCGPKAWKPMNWLAISCDTTRQRDRRATHRPNEKPAMRRAFRPDHHASLRVSASGCGSPGWIRTTECLSQSQVPYRLATGL